MGGNQTKRRGAIRICWHVQNAARRKSEEEEEGGRGGGEREVDGVGGEGCTPGLQKKAERKFKEAPTYLFIYFFFEIVIFFFLFLDELSISNSKQCSLALWRNEKFTLAFYCRWLRKVIQGSEAVAM